MRRQGIVTVLLFSESCRLVWGNKRNTVNSPLSSSSEHVVGTDGISPLQEDSMTVLMSAYLIRSRVVPRNNGFRLYNYYMVVGMRAFFISTKLDDIALLLPPKHRNSNRHSCCEMQKCTSCNYKTTAWQNKRLHDSQPVRRNRGLWNIMRIMKEPILCHQNVPMTGCKKNI